MAGLPSFAPMLPVIVLVWRIRALIRRFLELQAVSPESAVPIATLAWLACWIGI